MIALFTDYGLAGPYVGQLHAVISQHSPGSKIIDLMHDVPSFDTKAAAYLLPSLISPFPVGTVFCCVIDPGVGSLRLPCLVEADGNYFVGPDNGLFTLIAQRASHVRWHSITWKPQHLSDTFHGRDLFAPVAAMLEAERFPDMKLEDADAKIAEYEWQADYPALIYMDSFGNMMTGIQADSLENSDELEVSGIRYQYAGHFAAVAVGQAFWYRNSLGLVEVAVNTGRAELLPGMSPGASVNIIKN